MEFTFIHKMKRGLISFSFFSFLFEPLRKQQRASISSEENDSERTSPVMLDSGLPSPQNKPNRSMDLSPSFGASSVGAGLPPA